MKKALLVFSLFFFVSFADAANIELEPRFPAPGDLVRANVIFDDTVSYKPEIIWMLDDKILKAEEDASVNIQAPDLGKYKTLKAIIKYRNKSPEILSLKIKSSTIDIIWEALTYTPPLYAGSALPSIGSDIRVYAIADLGTIDSKKLIYTWFYNDKMLKKESGQGKNTLILGSEYFADKGILGLEVLDPDTLQILGAKNILIEYRDPEITLYFKDDLLGWVFEKAIDSLFLSNKKVIIAIPFHMSAKYLFDENIKWNWFVNNIEVDELKANLPYVEVSFISPDKESAILSVTAKFIKHILQKAEVQIHLIRSENDMIDLSGNEENKDAFGI
jgi:hypothetical protein